MQTIKGVTFGTEDSTLLQHASGKTNFSIYIKLLIQRDMERERRKQKKEPIILIEEDEQVQKQMDNLVATVTQKLTKNSTLATQ